MESHKYMQLKINPLEQIWYGQLPTKHQNVE